MRDCKALLPSFQCLLLDEILKAIASQSFSRRREDLASLILISSLSEDSQGWLTENGRVPGIFGKRLLNCANPGGKQHAFLARIRLTKTQSCLIMSKMKGGALFILGRHETLVTSMLPGLWGYIEEKWQVARDCTSKVSQMLLEEPHGAPGKARSVQVCNSMFLGGFL
jgi:hypothetical protein